MLKRRARPGPRARPRARPAAAGGFLRNATRSRVLSSRGKVLRGASMGLGAMFRGLPGSLVFVWWRSTRIAITNLFVPEDIDILWLDQHGRVVDLAERFKAGAWRVANTVPAKFVVELPAGTIAKTRTVRGDLITCSEQVFRP